MRFKAARALGLVPKAEPNVPGCTGKVRHDTRAEAESHVASLLMCGNMFPGERPYECKHCGGFHVGRRPHK